MKPSKKMYPIRSSWTKPHQTQIFSSQLTLAFSKEKMTAATSWSQGQTDYRNQQERATFGKYPTEKNPSPRATPPKHKNLLVYEAKKLWLPVSSSELPIECGFYVKLASIPRVLPEGLHDLRWSILPAGLPGQLGGMWWMLVCYIPQAFFNEIVW